MSAEELRFVEVDCAALAGQATALAAAAVSGRVAAGDDRGEFGLWDASGERLLALRMPAPICDVALSGAGDLVAVRSADGLLRVMDGKGAEKWSLQIEGAGLVRVDPPGESVWCIDAEAGAAVVLNAWGKRIGGFAIPSPVVGCVVHPRDGSLLVSTRRGIVARFAPWGDQIWAVDLARQTGGLSIDLRGTLLVAASYGRGADAFAPDRGIAVGAHDVGRSVEAAAAARSFVLLATSDGGLHLLDRAGRVLADRRGGARAVQATLRDDGRHAAVRSDDGTVRFWHISAFADETRPRRVAVGAAGEGRFPPRETFRHRVHSPGVHTHAPLVALSPCGGFVAVTGDGRRVLLFARDGTLLQEARHEGQPLALHCGERGRTVLVTTREIRRLKPTGSRVPRRFQLDLWRGAVTPDGAVVGVIDELGTVRLVDATKGKDLLVLESDAADPGRVILPIGRRVAVQTRRGDVVISDAQQDVRVPTPESTEPPKLVAVTDSGPVLVSGAVLASYAWDGTRRWQHRLPAAPTGVLAAPDGTLVTVAGPEARRFTAQGSAAGHFAAPPGRLAAVTDDEDEGLVLVFHDGRRVAVTDADGNPIWHGTLRDPLVYLAIARGGRSLAAVAGDSVVLLETVPGGGPLEGEQRSRADASHSC